MNENELIQNVRKVVESGGSLDDVVKLYTSEDSSSDEFKKMKTNISHTMTSIRKRLKDRGKKEGINPDLIYNILPVFRKNTMKASTDALFEEIIAGCAE